MGDGEILFADYGEHTYFTRSISGVDPGECFFSIKAKFSGCGGYLHLVSYSMALCTGSCFRPGDDNRDTSPKPIVHTIIEITTYRLSKGKVTRRVPRLIYRNMFDLDAYNRDEDVRSPTPMFTVTWEDDYVYIANNKWQLQVYRVPLFWHVQERESGVQDAYGIAENDGNVYLPYSTRHRKVFYSTTSMLDSLSAASGRYGSRNTSLSDNTGIVEVTISSLVAKEPTFPKPEKTNLVKEYDPPQVIYLTRSQFGSFTKPLYCKHGRKCHKRIGASKGGQLLSKFEKYIPCIRCGRNLLTGEYW